MSNRIFQLHPFKSNKSLPHLKITSKITRLKTELKASYKLEGNLDQIILPPVNKQVKRQDNLWQTTCFELFLAVFNAPEYWEFNLSPTGDWNVYAFSKYRRGMRTAASFQELPFQIIHNSNNLYELLITVDLTTIISGNTPLEIAATTVIEDTNHNLSYWAITHPGTEADFHRRDSFIAI